VTYTSATQGFLYRVTKKITSEPEPTVRRSIAVEACTHITKSFGNDKLALMSIAMLLEWCDAPPSETAEQLYIYVRMGRHIDTTKNALPVVAGLWLSWWNHFYRKTNNEIR